MRLIVNSDGLVSFAFHKVVIDGGSAVETTGVISVDSATGEIAVVIAPHDDKGESDEASRRVVRIVETNQARMLSKKMSVSLN